MSEHELDSTSPRQRQLVIERSGSRCEVGVFVPALGVWTRCFTAPVEVHHMLTRARGGDLLDRAGSTYHLIALCQQHHIWAHRYGYEVGLMLSGYVSLDSATGRIYYSGPDAHLQATYPDPREELTA